MTTKELEGLVRTLWQSTSVPLTNGFLQRESGLAKSELEHAMRGLLRAGQVDIDVDDRGELCWVVPNLARADRALAERVTSQTVRRATSGAGVRLAFEVDPNRKSILLSGGLGLVFGPFGWLYAGPWKEVAAGIAVYVLLGLLVPRFLLGTLFGLVHPTCGVLATLYAWRFNQAGLRTPILFAKTYPRSHS